MGERPGLLRDLVECVPGFGVPEGFAFGGFEGLGGEVVDVALGEAVDFEAHLELVRGDGGGGDFRGDLIDLGAAVFGLVDIGPRIHGVGGGVAGGGGIDGAGEGEFEAVRPGAHVMDLEGHLAGPADALEGERLAAARGPAAVGAADEERAILGLAHGDDAGLEAFQEMEHRALVEAVDLFEVDALDLRVGLLADEHLLLPRAEFAAAEIAGDAAGRLADLGMRQDDGGRDELGELLPLGEDAGGIGGLRWRGEFVAVPVVAARVALEGSGLEPLQAGGTVPRALVVGVEGIALGIEADAAG